MNITHSVHEMMLDFQTASQLYEIIGSVKNFIQLEQEQTATWNRLKEYGEGVLQDLQQADGD